MKVVFYECEFWDGVYKKAQIAAKLKGHTVKFIDGSVNNSNIMEAKDADAVCTFVFSKIGKKELHAWKKCKLIATMSTGYNHINLKEAKKKKVTICNVPTYGSVTVAEYTFGLMLALSRKIALAYDKARAGKFDLNGLRGMDLEGKTLGIIGFGRIGQNVATRATAFGMKVIAYDPNSKEVGREGTETIITRNLEDVLKKSDIITLHSPLLESTYHMINKESINKMKKGVMIINTARGELIDSAALVQGLLSKKIAGAAIDVIEEETTLKNERKLFSENMDDAGSSMKTVVANHVLIEMNCAIVTVHNAFNTREAVGRIVDTTVENVKMFSSKKVQNVVGVRK